MLHVEDASPAEYKVGVERGLDAAEQIQRHRIRAFQEGALLRPPDSVFGAYAAVESVHHREDQLLRLSEQRFALVH